MRDGVPYGDFFLLQKLAAGGFAELFLARARSRTNLPPIFAIKRVNPDFAADPQFLATLLDEARLVAQAAHPNLVQVYEIGTAEDDVYIAMEYVHGVDLAQLVKAVRKKGERFQWPFAAKIAWCLCEALDYAHNLIGLDGQPLHLVHRDVNPTNVMVEYSGGVKLIDFGIAKAAFRSQETRPGMVKVKLGYAAPEQYRQGPVDARTDVYGVGVTLFEMLSGDPPFKGDRIDEILSQSPPSISEARPDVPAALASAVDAALAKDPDRRPQSARELGQILSGALSEWTEPIGAEQLAAYVSVFVAVPEYPDPENTQVGPLTAQANAAEPATRERTMPRTAEVQPMPLRIGDRIGRYEIVDKIAVGGMGEVWRARQLDRDDRPVCLKTISEVWASNPEFQRLFLDEARLSALLAHPNVVEIYELGMDRGRHFIAMELLDGLALVDIAERILAREERFPPEVAAEVLIDACAALHFAHELRDGSGKALEIIHRDVSLENIFVTWAGQVKLLDFGIARGAVSSHHTQPGVVRGKSSYLSPEQVRGAPVDRRIDVWALGVVAYFLACNQMPFRGGSRQEVAAAILTATPPPPSAVAPSVPPELDRIVMRALQKNPDERYATAAAMQGDLEAFLRSREAPFELRLAQWMRMRFGRAEHTRTVVVGSPFSDEPEGRRFIRPAAVTVASARVELTRVAEPARSDDTQEVSEIRAVPRETSGSSSTSTFSVRQRRVGPIAVGAVSAVLVAAFALWWGFGTVVERVPASTSRIELAPVREESGTERGQKRDEAQEESRAVRPVERERRERPPQTHTAMARPSRAAEPDAPRGGTLVITSNVEADVYIDGRKVGTTDAIVRDLAAGKRQLRVVAPTGARKELSVKISAGAVTKRTVSFGQGTLALRVQPWANVKIDKKLVGETPMPPVPLVEGRHEVVLENPEINRRKRLFVTIRPGREESLVVNLKD